MGNMGNYCKAYQVKDLRAFAGWDASAVADRSDRPAFEDDDILYIQEDFVVTDGILKDQRVVFDNVTEEWKTFCRSRLRFEIPAWCSEVAEPVERDPA